MSNPLSLLKKVNEKEIDFNGGKVTVKELTFNEVKEFSDAANADNDNVDELESNRKSLADIIRKGVVGMEDIKDEDLGDASLASLKELSEAVLGFNGLKVTDDEDGSAAGND